MRLWTGIRSAIHNSDRCRNGLGGIGLCGCGYGHVIAARNRIRGQITDGNSTGCPSRGKRAARSDGSAGEADPAILGIVGDGRGDTGVAPVLSEAGGIKPWLNAIVIGGGVEL